MNNHQLTTILQQIDPNIFITQYTAYIYTQYIYTQDQANQEYRNKLYLGLYDKQTNTLRLQDTTTIQEININDPHFINKFTNWLNNFNTQRQTITTIIHHINPK